eukprot:1312173-Amphidinium_carterae.2
MRVMSIAKEACVKRLNLFSRWGEDVRVVAGCICGVIRTRHRKLLAHSAKLTDGPRWKVDVVAMVTKTMSQCALRLYVPNCPTQTQMPHGRLLARMLIQAAGLEDEPYSMVNREHFHAAFKRDKSVSMRALDVEDLDVNVCNLLKWWLAVGEVARGLNWLGSWWQVREYLMQSPKGLRASFPADW